MVQAKRWLLNTPVNLGLTLLLFLAACGSPEAPTVPSSPTNVTATPGPGYVTVQWKDTSEDETGFDIYRSDGATLSAQQAGSKVGSVGANETEFVDLDIELAQDYDYSVVAVSSVGSSGPTPAAAAASVPVGVDLMVGTNNRRWTEESNGTLFAVYFVFPQALLDDQSILFETVMSGPPGWNGGNTMQVTCAWNQCDRAKGFLIWTLGDITAVPGEYNVTVTAGTQQFQASATLNDELYKYPRATDFTVSNPSSSGATVSWTAPDDVKSHYLTLYVGEYGSYVDAWVTGPESSFTIEGMNLPDGLYGVEVVAFNTDILNYPLKVEPYGLSYDLVLFGVGDISSSECSSPSQVISIPDAALQQVVREELSKPTGDISCQDMALVTSISAPDAGIADLEGLQYATNLAELFIHDNDVSDVSVLAGLTNLWHLNLNVNEVTDVTPLAGLTGLIELHLCCASGNITDVSPLAGLTQLVGLNLSDHDLGDATLWPLLENYPNLQRLWINSNSLTTLAPLVANSAIGDGDYVDLRFNDFDFEDAAVQADLQALLDKGVDLDY